MVARVLIIGGYGNFGSHIATSLADDEAIRLLIGGRNAQKAADFAASLGANNAAEGHHIDIDGDLSEALARIAPDIVIHTTGPFQMQDHRVARACIAYGAHYIDLADSRSFVTTIGTLNDDALAKDVLVVSGASSVPCLTAAIIDEYAPDFSELEEVDYGIGAAQQTNRGLATTSAVLSYVGKPIKMLRDGEMKTVYGWQDTHAVRYPELGTRLFGNCEIPDLDLFPARYPSLKSMRFCAGHELKLLHLGTLMLGTSVRAGIVGSLSDYAGPLLRLAQMFDPLGSGKSGFHMFLHGKGQDGEPLQRDFWIIARQAHGPYIPCIPSIVLAQRLARGEQPERGAMPCVDLIDLDTYLAALTHLDIDIIRPDTNNGHNSRRF